MQTTLTVLGMSCSHCADAITKGLSVLDGTQAVTVDLAAKTVTISHGEGFDTARAAEIIDELGFDVE